jgi:hypothetical protein
MRIRVLREALMAVAVPSTAPAHGAEIVLEQSAVQKLVVESLFKDNGRYYIQRGACSAGRADSASRPGKAKSPPSIAKRNLCFSCPPEANSRPAIPSTPSIYL